MMLRTKTTTMNVPMTAMAVMSEPRLFSRF